MGQVSSNQQDDAQVGASNTNMQLVSRENKLIQLDEVNIEKDVYAPLKQLVGWTLKDIRQVYDTFQRRSKNTIAFIDKNFFCKIVPLSKINASYIFDHFSRGKRFISVYEFVSILAITSYSHYINKIQFFYVLFDLDCIGSISLNELLIIFKSSVQGYCKLTNCVLPDRIKLEKFAKIMFLRSDIQADNSLELREIIEWCENNQKAMEIFKKFEPKYLITEEYRVFQFFKPYSEEDAKLMLNQIDKSNKNEIQFFQDLEKVVNGIGHEKSYLQQTDSFKHYQLTRQRAQSQQQLKRPKSSASEIIPEQLQTGRQQNNPIKEIKMFNNFMIRPSSVQKRPSFPNQNQSRQSLQQTQQLQQQLQQQELTTERKIKQKSSQHSINFFQNLRSSDNNEEHDQDDAINFALNSHMKSFKKQEKLKQEEFLTNQKDDHQKKKQVLFAKVSRIKTEQGIITRKEILKLKDFYDFINTLKKIDELRIQQQQKREQQDKIEEGEKIIENDLKIEQLKQKQQLIQNLGKFNGGQSGSSPIQIQQQQFQLQQEIQSNKLIQLKQSFQDNREKRDNYFNQKQQIQNEKINKEKQSIVSEFEELFLRQNKNNEKLLHERKKQFVEAILLTYLNQHEDFNLEFLDLVKEVYPVLTRQPMVIQRQNYQIIQQWIEDASSKQEENEDEKNVIIARGTALTKNEIHKMKQYFDILSEKDKTIKIVNFQKSMQDKKHMKRLAQSLFQYLDKESKSEVTFQQYVQGIHPSLQKNQLQIVDRWVNQYQKTFDMQTKELVSEDNNNNIQTNVGGEGGNQYSSNKRKRVLPASTMIRIKEIFGNFDEEKKGYLIIKNLINKFSYGFTEKDIENLFKKHDLDKDGKLQVEDFVRMILPPDYQIENDQDDQD